MNRYQSSTPRALFGLSALAMSAITIGALVVLPAKLDAVSIDPELIAAANAATNPTVHVAAALACGDVHDGIDRMTYVRGDAGGR